MNRWRTIWKGRGRHTGRRGHWTCSGIVVRFLFTFLFRWVLSKAGLPWWRLIGNSWNRRGRGRRWGFGLIKRLLSRRIRSREVRSRRLIRRSVIRGCWIWGRNTVLPEMIMTVLNSNQGKFPSANCRKGSSRKAPPKTWWKKWWNFF